MTGRQRRLLRLAVLIGLIIAGMWQFGSGVYIHAKALLAQHLLRGAWAATLAAQDGLAKRQKPWPWADTWPSARLMVPSLGVDLIVLAGDNGRSLAFGPGYRLGMPAPGEAGLTLISAHRDTHFEFLQYLRIGDDLLVETAHGALRQYRVSDTLVVEGSGLALPPLDTEPSTLVLATCYPFDALTPGGPLRYLVVAHALPDTAI